MHIPPDWGIFGAQIVSFVVFWFIFGRLFFGPFLKILGDRERRLKELGDRTAELLREERAATEQRESQLAAVRREMLARREQQRHQAEADAARLIEAAREEAKAQMDRMRDEIQQEFAAAQSQLDQMAEILAGDLAQRLLRRPVTNGRAALISQN
jgi:F-type H+-transporting ATPase subunit b